MFLLTLPTLPYPTLPYSTVPYHILPLTYNVPCTIPYLSRRYPIVSRFGDKLLVSKNDNFTEDWIGYLESIKCWLLNLMIVVAPALPYSC